MSQIASIPTARKCIDCSKVLTGHNKTSQRCRVCSTRYVWRSGKRQNNQLDTSGEVPIATCKCSEKFTPTKYQLKVRKWRCPKCHKRKQAAWRAKRQAEGKRITPIEKCRAYRAEYQKRPEVKRKNREASRYRRSLESEKIKIRAREIVAYAIKSGVLNRQPCENCGDPAHAHHDDYTRPLNVRWLCPLHHNELHKRRQS